MAEQPKSAPTQPNREPSFLRQQKLFTVRPIQDTLPHQSKQNISYVGERCVPRHPTNAKYLGIDWMALG